jgi:threonine aldolase
MTWKAGIDVLSLGGTKNGCLGVEGVVLFNPERPGSWNCAASGAGTSSPSTASSRRRWRLI